MRLLWLSFLLAPVVLVRVAFAITDGKGDPESVLVFVVAVLSIFDMVALVWFRRLGDSALLTSETNEELRLNYLRRLTLGLAFAVSPVLVGFTISIATDSVVLVVITGAVSIPAVFFAGPRSGDIRSTDEALIAAGRPLRLSATLGE